jgi:hypothetical protein
MARQRDHAAEYARRQELAQERGYRSAYEERQQRSEIRQQPGAEATLKLTGGRKVDDPGRVQRFIREYTPGTLKIDQLKERVRDLLSTTPLYDVPGIPEGMDIEEVLDLYGDDVFDEPSDVEAMGDMMGGLPFDQFDDDDWDAYFESDEWYDFLDELYADK